MDTAQAFEKMGIEQDIRKYSDAVKILKQLDITEIRLVSNNPRKRQYLIDHGIEVKIVNTNPNVRPENEDYLHTKNNKLGHLIPLNIEADNEKPVFFYHSDQPWGELSNFSRHSVFIDGLIWPTTEHYYQAQKFVMNEQQEIIRCAASPMLAKSLASDLQNKIEKTDWHSARDGVMLKALRAKFSQHPDLAIKLLSTNNRNLIERSNNDRYWGDPGDGSGQNKLGQLLMQVRSEIRLSEDKSPIQAVR